MRFLAPSVEEIRTWGRCFSLYPGATATGSSDSNLEPLTDGGLSAAIPLQGADHARRLCEAAWLDPASPEREIDAFQTFKLGLTGTNLKGAVAERAADQFVAAGSSGSASGRSAKFGVRSRRGRASTSPSSRPARCALNARMGPVPRALDQPRAPGSARHSAPPPSGGPRPSPPGRTAPETDGLARPRVDEAGIETARPGERQREPIAVVGREE